MARFFHTQTGFQCVLDLERSMTNDWPMDVVLRLRSNDLTHLKEDLRRDSQIMTGLQEISYARMLNRGIRQHILYKDNSPQQYWPKSGPVARVIAELRTGMVEGAGFEEDYQRFAGDYDFISPWFSDIEEGNFEDTGALENRPIAERVYKDLLRIGWRTETTAVWKRECRRRAQARLCLLREIERLEERPPSKVAAAKFTIRLSVPDIRWMPIHVIESRPPGSDQERADDGEAVLDRLYELGCSGRIEEQAYQFLWNYMLVAFELEYCVDDN